MPKGPSRPRMLVVVAASDEPTAKHGKLRATSTPSRVARTRCGVHGLGRPERECIHDSEETCVELKADNEMFSANGNDARK